MGLYVAPGGSIMKEYVIYRYESADPNEKRAVARVEADSPEEACRQAARHVTLAAGQYLSAEPASPLDAHEADLNKTARAIRVEP
jgi:hypothetical protein